ncbi:MAG TPA: type II toxin-antitoxin system VapC family toxin [Anaerolineales bacterium]|nr:type II toxin-antitoxin system VapC family toxin [Anaerolineales bacterium]
MIVYADASALAKRYLAEAGSAEIETLVRQADIVGTSVITRVEVSAAIAKAVRIGSLERTEAERILRAFRQHWLELGALQVTEALVAEADTLAWEHGLRGYDAVHLASALVWQEAISEPVVLAAFDRQLWDAAQKVGLSAWPESL